jgi:hypothetical protein
MNRNKVGSFIQAKVNVVGLLRLLIGWRITRKMTNVPRGAQVAADRYPGGPMTGIGRSILLAGVGFVGLLSSDSSAQAPTGGGSGGSVISLRARANYMFERRDTSWFVTVLVVRRGQESWAKSATPDPSQTAALRDAARRKGPRIPNSAYSSNVSGEYVLSIENQRDSGQVILNGIHKLRNHADSTLIVMIDRVDSVGGPPVVTSVMVPLLRRSEIDNQPAPSDSVAVVRERQAQTQLLDTRLTRYLEMSPVVREFIKQG